MFCQSVQQASGKNRICIPQRQPPNEILLHSTNPQGSRLHRYRQIRLSPLTPEWSQIRSNRSFRFVRELSPNKSAFPTLALND